MFASVSIASSIELLQDSHFKNGFHLLGTSDIHQLPNTVKNILRLEQEATGPTIWRLAEWNSNSTLATYEDYNSWADDSSSTGWRWSNPSKSITLGFGRGSSDITFAINSINDYNNIYSLYPDTGNLPNGTYLNWWTHLLVEQIFNVPLQVKQNLIWSFDAKLAYWHRYRGQDANGNMPTEKNVGEFVTYLLIRNKYNHTQQLWLGMTIFDTSSDGTNNYSAPDVHTNINIYKTGVPQASSTWKRYEKNITNLLTEALQAYNGNLPITIENAEIISFNMGWEIRGLDIGTMAINNLSIRSYSTYSTINYPLTKPTNLTFSNITSDNATLTWKDNSNNENGFKIYQDDELIVTLPANTKNFEVSNLQPRTKYSYTIKSYNDSTISDGTSNSFITKDDYAWLISLYPILF